MQEPPAQLTQVPPKPACVRIFNTGTCVDLWTAYNHAVEQRSREELQIYVNRQKEIASSQATAPVGSAKYKRQQPTVVASGSWRAPVPVSAGFLVAPGKSC